MVYIRPIGRRIDRQPWDRVQVAVAAGDLLAILLLLGALLKRIPEATIGNMPLLMYGIGIGCLGIAPWVIRVMVRSQTWRKMDRPNPSERMSGIKVGGTRIAGISWRLRFQRILGRD